MEYFLNQLINGVCQGAIYALIAIGYSVIVGVVGMVTFTYGEVIMVGAFAAYYTFQLIGTNIFLAIAASFVASFLVGGVVYKFCYERFFNAPRHISLLCTIGFSTLIKNLAQIIFGPDTKPMINIIDNTSYNFSLFGASIIIKKLQIVVLVLVLISSLVLTLLFQKTKYGIALRAVSQDKTAAYMVGINIRKTALIGNCIGCGFGGIAGILLSIYYYSCSPLMGSSFSMKAFSSSVLGGLTDIRMSAIGGLCIGVIENLGITISSAMFRDVFAFAFLIIVLVFKPEGFASNKRKRGK